jgi:ketosteroid isomerase-like protein
VEQNIEILRRMFETWNRRDFDGLGQFFDAAVELYPGLQPPGEQARYIGHDGVNEWIRNVNDLWVAVTVEPLERIENESKQVLSIDRWHFQGRGGIEVTEELPTLFTFENGLIVRVNGFTDRVEALVAAGLLD